MLNLLIAGIGNVFRNKLLAETFYLTGDIEKYGTGFKRLRNWFASYKNIVFEIKDTTDFIRIKVKESKNVFDKAQDKSEKTVGESSEKTVEKIISLIIENPKITQAELAEKTGLSRRGVEWNLKQLKQKRIICRVEPANSGHWECIQK